MSTFILKKKRENSLLLPNSILLHNLPFTSLTIKNQPRLFFTIILPGMCVRKRLHFITIEKCRNVKQVLTSCLRHINIEIKAVFTLIG